MRKVVILTAVQIERKAVRAHLKNLDEVVHPSGTIYDVGTFTSERGDWQVALVQMGMGNVQAAVMAQQAIDHFSPDILLFVGIAGGIKKVKPGDVVASSKIYEYASGKVGEDNVFYPRPEVGLAAHGLIQRAMRVIADEEWPARIINSSPTDSPLAYVGPIAAGEQVVSSTTAPIVAFLKQRYEDALALEMEGYGVLNAARANSRVQAMVIRGISDDLGDKEELDKRIFQETAARHASAFAFEMLAKMAGDLSKMANDLSKEALPPKNLAPSEIISPSPVRVKICYSYVSADEDLIKKLKMQLAMQRRLKHIEEWDATEIFGGSDVENQMQEHLEHDDIFVLGLSSAYVGSDDHYTQMEEALKQRERGAEVIPVLLRPVDTKDLPTHKLLLLPRSQKPVSSSSDPEVALKEIADEIKRVINGHLGKK